MERTHILCGTGWSADREMIGLGMDLGVNIVNSTGRLPLNTLLRLVFSKIAEKVGLDKAWCRT